MIPRVIANAPWPWSPDRVLWRGWLFYDVLGPMLRHDSHPTLEEWLWTHLWPDDDPEEGCALPNDAS